ncbi:MAG: Flp pilus assembly protein CpaB [Armatimonadota bacterium]
MRQVARGKVLVIALVLGVLSSGLVYVFLAKQAERARAEIAVVTAQQAIRKGTIIEAGMVGIQSVPRNIIPPGTAVNTGAVIGRVASREIRPGEPVSVDCIASRDRLSYEVPLLMRAVTVAVDPVIAVGGFLKPGDRVDVIATFSVNDATVTRTVLQNVQLLAIGSRVSDVKSNRARGEESTAKPAQSPNATLAVLPRDAEKLVLADSKGEIRLSLRRPDDNSYVRPVGITGRAMIGTVPPDMPKDEDEAKDEKNSEPVQDVMRELVSLLKREMAHPQPESVKQANSAAHPKEQNEPKPSTVKKVQVIRGTSSQEVVISE